MIKKILVPLDRSELSEEALPTAAALAAGTGALITLAAIVVPDERWSSDPGTSMCEHAEESAALYYLEKIEDQLLDKGVSARSLVGCGPAAVTLARFADDEDADVIVMSTHGRSGMARWVMGSVADKLLHITSRPMLLVHPTTAGGPNQTTSIERILVPLDGSSHSESVLPFVEGLVSQLGASLVLQQAVLPVTLFAGEFIPPMESLQEPAAGAHEYLGRIANLERSLGISTEVEVDVGASADAILRAAERTGSDLIVLSTHGRSGPMRWVLGSVADALVRMSTIPVLIVPAKAAAAHPDASTTSATADASVA